MFENVFRQKYHAARVAAVSNNLNQTIAALDDLSETLNVQSNMNNGDPLLTKGTLRYWAQKFSEYAQIARRHGLKDARLQRLFALPIPFTDNSSKSSNKVNEITETPNFDLSGLGLSKDDSQDSSDVGENTEENKDSETVIGTFKELPSADISTTEVENTNNEVIYSDEIPSYDPESLRGFIGQKHVVTALLKEIAIAKNEGRNHLDNILLLGNPGLGKTTLMRLIAKDLGVQFEFIDCSQFRNSQQSLKALQNFFQRVAKINAPVVIGMDEIHMLTPELQSSLLTLLNDRIYVSPLDINGQCQRFEIPEFTFIGATTDDDKVLDTVKNRCLRLKFQLVDYTPEELTRIYRNKFAAKNITVSDEAIALCVPRSRGAIRYVNSIVDGLNNELYTDDGIRFSTHVSEEIACNYFAKKGIDPMGLEAKDLEILNAIADARDGVISAEVLSAQVGLDPKKYLSEYERYLIKIGFISISGRGRSLTEKARKYLVHNNGNNS